MKKLSKAARIREWLPTSKMTAVGVSGGFVVWGTWAIHEYYGVLLEPWVAAFWTLGISWCFGYVVTEHRETILKLTNEIHQMVNSRLSQALAQLAEALARITQLDDTIKEAGLASPKRPDDE